MFHGKLNAEGLKIHCLANSHLTKIPRIRQAPTRPKRPTRRSFAQWLRNRNRNPELLPSPQGR